VYLPANQHIKNWYDWHTGKVYSGDHTVQVETSLDTIPVFIAEGAIIPAGKVSPTLLSFFVFFHLIVKKVMKNIGAEPDDLREIYIFPQQQQSSSEKEHNNSVGAFVVVEDDGVSTESKTTRLRLTCDVDVTGVKISITSIEREYPLPYSSITFILPPHETRHLAFLLNDKVLSSSPSFSSYLYLLTFVTCSLLRFTLPKMGKEGLAAPSTFDGLSGLIKLVRYISCKWREMEKDEGSESCCRLVPLPLSLSICLREVSFCN